MTPTRSHAFAAPCGFGLGMRGRRQAVLRRCQARQGSSCGLHQVACLGGQRRAEGCDGEGRGALGRSFALIARPGGIGAGSVASNRSRAALAIASHSLSLMRLAAKSQIISINRSCSSGLIASNSRRNGARISATLCELTCTSGLSASLSAMRRPDRSGFFTGRPVRSSAISNLRLA